MQITISKDSLSTEKHPSEWVTHPDGGDYLIAGINRPSFQYMQDSHQQKERMVRESGALITDEFVEQSNRVFSGIVGKYLVLGWRDIPAKIEYSAQMAHDLLAYGKSSEDDEYGMKLGLWVIAQSQRIQIEADHKKTEIMGKSLSSTDGQKSQEASPTTKKRSTKSSEKK
ncbi:hypothetical protein [Acinetobacter indicus]|uniref:hypothetical protein n=1 Tax=Acinetobacter indicus TaxID=756892 RepID=UPI000FD99F02|nr:hypothetical protein [Acinetobacter indicus]RVT36904.1 hypothetical protein ENC20_04255 [Acinetobacter indicus]